MRRDPARTAATAAVLLLAVLLGGCADPADDPRVSGGPRASGTPGGGGMRYCPGPEEPPLPTPVPCVSQDPAQKYAENHAYRREQELTAEERAGAREKADALGRALKGLVGKPGGEADVRAAAAAALGLAPGDLEYRQGASGKVLRNVLVGGGRGKVCVNGGIGDTGDVTAEVAGRTMDGTCLPGLGGH
ncbi:precorrin-3B C(17)-methyltransferase [Streptomyces sp. NPDC001744]|uniref:precorrin-3B C(17)-methyltransferase n=1 Tax=Streptomyces sp. NPDC001744 TaxID=3364606 RepID=UPI0036965113